MAAPASEPCDWQSLYEQAQARMELERARADGAEARAEELLVAERTLRSQASSLKRNLDQSRDELKAAVEEVKEIWRTAKDALFYQSEVARLEKLLSEAGVDSRKRSTLASLRMEIVRLRRDLRAAETAKDTAAAQVSESALEPGLPIVDPHHHLWDRPDSRYMLDDLLADIGGGHNVTAAVFVECMSMYRADGPVGETEFANGVAAQSVSGAFGDTRVCAGIVRFADLTLGVAVDEVLEAQRLADGEIPASIIWAALDPLAREEGG